MKQLKYLLIIALGLFACKKSEIPFYTAGDGISFYIGQYDTDSLTYSFAFNITEKQQDTVFLNMRVAGAAADRPRQVKVKAGAGTTAREGVDYELPVVTVPAGALTVAYPVVLHSTPEMKTQTFRLVAEVAVSSDFTVGPTGQEIGKTISVNAIKIDFTNRILKPGYWSQMESAFGTFSEVKFRFMIQVLGITDFSFEAIGYDGYYNYPVKLRNALAAYEATNGTLLDENGDPVIF